MTPRAGSRATSPCSGPRRGAALRLALERPIAVIQAWGKPESAAIALTERAGRAAAGWVLALDAIDQSWVPRAGVGAERAVTCGGFSVFLCSLTETNMSPSTCDGRDTRGLGRRTGWR